MSVFQVEEYYVHINLSGYSAEKVNAVINYLDGEGFDHDTDSHSVTVDRFECNGEAHDVENKIINILMGS